MSDRLIFSIKHDGKILAYLFQNWGAGDGENIEKEVKDTAREYNLDLTNRADAITALRIAGESIYGHALWNGNEEESNDKEWLYATREDREYLKKHEYEIITDNQDKDGFTFFYGISWKYVEYIDGFCDEVYTMKV